MKIDVHSEGSYRRRVEVQVPATTVREELDRAFNVYKKRAKIHGFRPGKVPRQVLELRFGEQIASDVAQQLIQKGWTETLKAHKLDVVSRPEVADQGSLQGDADFAFTIAVEVKPEVSLDAYKGFEVVHPRYEVADAEVERSVQARLQGQARLVEITDRAVQPGDMVLCELTARDGDTIVVQEPGTMIRTGGEVYYPGVEALLIGLSADQEGSGEVSFGADARIESVRGRTLAVTVKVLSIQANQVPELTDALAKELGHDDVAALQASIRKDLAKGRDDLARNQARANLLQVLIDKNVFDVPPGMVDQQLELLVQELKLQQAYRGVDPRTVQFSAAQMADLRMRAEFAVKGGLILDYVSKTENISVNDADLEAKYADLAAERGQTVEAIKGYFKKDDAVDELRARLLEEKTLDWLLDQAVVIDEAPKAEAAPKAAATPKAEAAPKAAAPAGEADLSLLKGTVKAIKEALESGAHDAHLDALAEAEQAGKARAGVLEAIASRRG